MKNSANSNMKKLANNLVLFYLLSFTWGILMSFIGLLVMIPFLLTGKVKTISGRLYGVFPKKFGKGWGFELGCFFFTSYDCYDCSTILFHEMGHGIQNIFYGPFMLFIVSIPSMIRFWYREIQMKKHPEKRLKPYDSIWFESQATNWGIECFGTTEF